MKKKFAKFAKIALPIAFAFCMVFVMSVMAYANPTPAPLDLANVIGNGVSDLTTQIMQIIAVVVPGVLTLVGVTLAIRKGISIFKGLTRSA
jgi:short subunit fatty acids transporter